VESSVNFLKLDMILVGLAVAKRKYQERVAAEEEPPKGISLLLHKICT